jgi:hypothetical protein
LNLKFQSGSEASFFSPDLTKIIQDDPLKLEIDRNIGQIIWSNITDNILVTRPTGFEAKTLSKVTFST